MTAEREDALRVPLSGGGNGGRELVISPDELRMEFARSGGPGGQNVNKVETKVVLRFDVEASRALSEAQRARLREKLASRLSTKGELVLHASRHRTRARNVEDARERLAGLLAEALRPERPRKATRPTRGSVQKRLEEKRKRAETKRRRREPDR